MIGSIEAVTMADLGPASSASRRRGPHAFDEPTHATRRERLALALVVAVGVATALYFFAARGSLWEDEIIAITHANQPLPLFFVEMLRHDIHPPLWFLQLQAWSALGGGDRWALVNSLAWAAVGLVVLHRVALAAHGERAAWYAVALFAIFPSFAWSAGTLRMYAMLPVLALAAYHANRAWYLARRPALLAGMFASEVLLVTMHAVEFYFVAFIVLAAWFEAAAAGRLHGGGRDFGRSMRAWLLTQAAVGVAILPFAASALLRGSDASAAESAGAALTTAGTLVGGWKASSMAWVRIGGTVVFFALAGCALASREARARTLVLPLFALAVALVVGIALKPIFKQPVFAANLLPFLALGAGAAAARLRGARTVVSIVLALAVVAAFPIARAQRPVEAYADAAAQVRRLAVSGDVVMIPSVSVFWGIARYAIANDWGRPLVVGEAPNDAWSRLDDKLSQRFGPGLVERLHLVPERHALERDGVRYVLSASDCDATRGAAHAWVVTRDRYASDVCLDAGLVPSTVVAPATFGDGELLVRRFDREAAAAPEPTARADQP